MSVFQSVMTVIAGVLFLVGFIPYIVAIICGKTKPAKASWIIWALLDTITLLGMYFEKAVNGQIVGAVLGVWPVVALSLRYGTPGWTRLDKFCLGGAIVGIVLWQVFSNPVLAIVTSQLVVFLGAIPTFVSAWKDPSKEDKLAWTIFWLSCVAAVFAIPAWTFEDATQPINYFIVESVMMYLLYLRRPNK